MNEIFIYGDIQFGYSGEFSYPSVTGYSTRLDNTLGVASWLCQLIEANKPKMVVSLGDVLEAMLMIDAASLSAAAKGMGMISQTCAKLGIKHYVVLGNHDLCTESRSVYSTEFLNFYPNTQVVSELLVDDTLKIALIPYINDTELFLNTVKDIPSDFRLFTHIDLAGIQLTGSGYKSEEGIDPKSLTRFKLVVNGHIHIPSKVSNNIIDLGSIIQTQYDQMAKDLPRGVMLLDDGDKYSMIPNIISPIIARVSKIEELKDLPDNSYVIYENKDMDEALLSSMLSRFAKFRINKKRDLQPIQDNTTFQSSDPHGLFEEYIGQLRTTLDKDTLKKEGVAVINKNLP